MKKFVLPVRVEVFIYTKVESKILYLLIKRIPEDGGFWQPVTGTQESDESVESCIFREVKEEVGYKKEMISGITEKIYEFTWMKKNKLICEFVFGIELKIKIDPVLSQAEHEDFKWVEFNEAMKTLKMKDNRNALKILNISLNNTYNK